MEDNGRNFFRFIYPIPGSGEAAERELQALIDALQHPLPVDDWMGVREQDGKLRDFTPEEKEYLGIANSMDDPKATRRFWEEAEANSGTEQVLYGNDEHSQLRERVFTNETDALAFRGTLTGRYIYWGPHVDKSTK